MTDFPFFQKFHQSGTRALLKTPTHLIYLDQVAYVKESPIGTAEIVLVSGQTLSISTTFEEISKILSDLAAGVK